MNQIEKFRILTFKASKEGTLLSEFMEDSLEAFKELGQEVFVLDLYGMRGKLSDSQRMGEVLYKTIEEFRPDFIFTITYFGLVPGLFDELKIPYVAWLTDDPITYEIPPSSRYFHLFIHEKGAIDEVKRLGYKNVHHLPLAANPNRYKGIPQDDEGLEEYECEVSFLGNADSRWEDGYDRHEHLKDLLSQEMINKIIDRLRKDPLLPALRAFFEVKNRDSVQNASSLAKDLESSHPKRAFQIKEWLKSVKLESMKWYRRDIIREVADQREIHLYGDTAWRWLDENSKAIYHGFLKADAAARLYNASKINICVQSNIYSTGLNYRTFTIPACGAFMVSDYRNEIVKLFEEGKEVVYFRKKEKLPEIIDYYLAHPEERNRIASIAQKRVLKEHTYVHRMKKILSVMREVIS